MNSLTEKLIKLIYQQAEYKRISNTEVFCNTVSTDFKPRPPQLKKKQNSGVCINLALVPRAHRHTHTQTNVAEYDDQNIQTPFDAMTTAL